LSDLCVYLHRCLFVAEKNERMHSSMKLCSRGQSLALLLAICCLPCWLAACGQETPNLAASAKPTTQATTSPAATGTVEHTQIAPARLEGTLAYDARRSVTVLFGGSDRNDTWLWDGHTWQQAHPATNPPGRTEASMAYDAVHGQIVLFGGVDARGALLGDTWIWNGTTWQQAHPDNAPSARALASMTYDAAHQRILLFGGEAASTDSASPPSNETWTWDGSNWQQLATMQSPPAQVRASMAYDAAQHYVLLFGGNPLSGASNETWTWDGSNWQQLHPQTVPPARSGAALVYDEAHHQTVLFAGASSAPTDLNDTWTWNGTNWTQRISAQAPGGLYTLGAYQSNQQEIVAYVVHTPNKTIGNSQTWLWNGYSWHLSSP
jgi:hypothetical protein